MMASIDDELEALVALRDADLGNEWRKVYKAAPPPPARLR